MAWSRRATGSDGDGGVTFVEAALDQAPRVAAARKLPVEQGRALTGRRVERSGSILGARGG